MNYLAGDGDVLRFTLQVFLSWYAWTPGTQHGCVARKWGENGQYYARLLAKGLHDKTVGKPPMRWTTGNGRECSTGNGVEEPLQTGSPAVTLGQSRSCGGSMYSRANVRTHLNGRALPSSKVSTEKVCDPNWVGTKGIVYLCV